MTTHDREPGFTKPGWHTATAPPQTHAAYRANLVQATALVDQLDALAASPAQDPAGLPNTAAARAYLTQLVRTVAPAAELAAPVGSAAQRTATARVTAAFLDGSFTTCPHLPAVPLVVALLPERVALCPDCLQAMTEPPPVVVPDDQCDLCGRRPVSQFTLTAIQSGIVVALGNLCRACLAVLPGAAGVVPKGWG